MFNINSNPIESNMPIIVNNYKDLLFDEMPILYIGTNKYGNRIIGSLIAEDYQNKFSRFLHTVIDLDTYYKFVSKSITYLEIITTCNDRYIVDETFNGEKFIFSIRFEDIPSEYLPLEDSYCPDIEHVFSFNYGASLTGKLADEHKAEVNDVNSIQTKLETILNSTLSPIEDLNLKPRTLLEPASIGSFRINFTIELLNNKGFFPVDEEKISNYLSSFFDFIFLKMPDEEKDVLRIFPDNLQPVKQALQDIYHQSNAQHSDAEIEESILENVNGTAKKVIDFNAYIENSDSFDKIEIINYGSDGHEYGVGRIDKGYLIAIGERVIEEAPYLSIIEEETDIEAKPYRILIYKLSSETGKGQARIYKDNTENYDKVFIHIKTHQPISKTYYSEGFHEGKVIDVRGIAKKKGGVFKYLTIEF